MKRMVYGALVLALLLSGSSLLTAVTTVHDLRIGGYTLVGKTRIGPLHWHLRYTATLTNGGNTAISGATAKLRPFLNILIVDGQLSFGPVAAVQSVTSSDTFTLRWPIAQPIDPRLLERLLRWDITLANAAPLANAGPDQTVPLNAAVQLDGQASSDPDGDPLTYRWAFRAKPASSTAVLSGADTATPTFVADRAGNYDVQLIVNDGQSDSTPDVVRISTANSAPSAAAGPDQTAFVGNTVTLDATASSDVDGDPITYRWSFTTQPAGSQALLSDPTASRPSFTVDKPGDYFIQLIVNDGKADSAPDSVQVSTQNSAPVADAGPDQSVFVNTLVQLDGGGSRDVDGDTLTYRWSLLNKPAGSTAVLANDQAVNPSFTVDKPGSYTVQLIVNDGTVDGAPDQTVVSTQNSRPVADAGDDQTAIVGNTVTLDGNGSQDADGDNLSFAWSLITQPSSSTAALTGATTATPTFIPDQAGDYIAQLIVDDGQLASPPDTALVTVSVPPPNQNPQITSSPVTT
ncbi:MAG: PKD domain-containing protein, partial [Gammaproteobacteria bacterium]